MASTEAGHHEKRVYLAQDGTLVVPSSARIQVEPGGLISEFGNTVSVAIGSVTTTTGAALPNRGISIIRTTQKTVHGIRAITKESVGARKLIIWDSSAIIKVRASTAPDGSAIKLGSSFNCIYQSSDIGKIYNKTGGIGAAMELVAVSTARWYISRYPFSTAGVTKGYICATST